MTAESFIKQRRSHRGCAPTIDDALDRLYFPEFYTSAGERVEMIEDSIIDAEDTSENPEDSLVDLNPEVFDQLYTFTVVSDDNVDESEGDDMSSTGDDDISSTTGNDSMDAKIIHTKER